MCGHMLRGHSISDVLEMTARQASQFFEDGFRRSSGP
jgi:excinuclease UvrABC ATPase subunit